MSLSPVARRLLPLYIGMFCQGMIFWYAVDKILITQLGGTNATIALSLIVYTVAEVLTEFPSGVLSDRWSRKGVLMLAVAFLGLSTVIGAMSGSIAVFLFSTFLWGIFSALISGTDQSLVYDTLTEETGGGKRYKHYYGHTLAAMGAAYFASSFAGGFMADWFGVREVFWLSVPSVIAALIAFSFIREPTVHKREEQESVLAQITGNIKIITSQHAVIPLVIVGIALGMLWRIIMELNTFWLLAVGAAPYLFGILNAFAGASIGTSGYLADRIRSRRAHVIAVALILVSLVGLTVRSSAVILIVWESLILILLYMYLTFLTHGIHDAVPSHYRNGAVSAISTATKFVVLPVAYGFGLLVDSLGVFRASWLLLALFIACLAYILLTRNQRRIFRTDGSA